MVIMMLYFVRDHGIIAIVVTAVVTGVSNLEWAFFYACRRRLSAHFIYGSGSSIWVMHHYHNYRPVLCCQQTILTT